MAVAYRTEEMRMADQRSASSGSSSVLMVVLMVPAEGSVTSSDSVDAIPEVPNAGTLEAMHELELSGLTWHASVDEFLADLRDGR